MTKGQENARDYEKSYCTTLMGIIYWESSVGQVLGFILLFISQNNSMKYILLNWISNVIDCKFHNICTSKKKKLYSLNQDKSSILRCILISEMLKCERICILTLMKYDINPHITDEETDFMRLSCQRSHMVSQG